MTGVHVWLHLDDDEPRQQTWFPALPRNSERIRVDDGREFVVTDVHFTLTDVRDTLVGGQVHVYARPRETGGVYPV